MLINKITEKREEMVLGEYRIINVDDQWLLTDASGVLPFSPANFDIGGEKYLPTQGEVVHAGLIIDYQDDESEIFGRVEQLDVPSRPLLAIPFPTLQYPELLVELDQYIQGLTCEGLREFLNHLFLDEQLALNFTSLPASKNHHHAEKGGLLQHVVEMVRYAHDGQFPLQPSNYERELLITAAVVHDIGKAHASANKAGLPALYRDHEELGKELLSEPLKWMALEYPKAAKDLVHALNDIFAQGNTYSTAVGCLHSLLDCALSFGSASEAAFNGLPRYRILAHLNGRKGPGWTYRRFPHVHLVK